MTKSISAGADEPARSAVPHASCSLQRLPLSVLNWTENYATENRKQRLAAAKPAACHTLLISQEREGQMEGRQGDKKDEIWEGG